MGLVLDEELVGHVLGSVAGLLLFNNRLLARPTPLFRPWDAVITFLGLSLIILFPALGSLEASERTLAIAGLTIFVGTRFMYRPVRGS